MNTIESLYEAGIISESEMDKLATIRSEFLSSLDSGPAATIEFVKETFSDCELEDLEKISEMVDAVENNLFADSGNMDNFVVGSMIGDVALEKIAGDSNLVESAGKLLGKFPGLKYVAAASLGLPFAVSMLGSVAQGINILKHPFQEAQDRENTKRMSQATLSSILKTNPELKADKTTMENFEVLKRYAPQTVATNKPMAEVMLKKMQQWGGVDPQSLQQMISMEKQHVENIKAKSLIPETQTKVGPAGENIVGAMFA